MNLETLLLIAAALATWAWIDGIGAREAAMALGRDITLRYGLQFLDETVALARIRTGRDAMGRLRLKRTYEFEVSSSGTERLTCHLTLLGRRLEAVYIPPYGDNVVQLH